MSHKEQPVSSVPAVWPGRPYPLGATWMGWASTSPLQPARRGGRAGAVRSPGRSCAFAHDRSDRTDGPDLACLSARSASRPALRLPRLRTYRPEEGHRFNPNKVLLDPYAKAIGRPLRWHDSLFGYKIGDPAGDLSFSEEDSAPYAPLGAVVEGCFEWGDDRPPRIPWEDTIIYETHVKGITKLHPEVPEPLRGTYLGLTCEPVLEHLKRLGVTTIQLLPVHAKVHDRHLVERGLRNYWAIIRSATLRRSPSTPRTGRFRPCASSR